MRVAISKVKLFLRLDLSVVPELEDRDCTCILVQQWFVDGMVVRCSDLTLVLEETNLGASYISWSRQVDIPQMVDGMQADEIFCINY